MDEKRRGLTDDKSSLFKGKDYTGLRVSPNSPLTAQMVEDKVVDMLIFLTFRYTQAFNLRKNASIQEAEDFGSPTKTEGGDHTKRTGASKSFAEGTQRTSAGVSSMATSQDGKSKGKKQNLVL
jgi:hypothetical protein